MSAQLNETTQYTDPTTGELLNNGYIYIGVNNMDAKLNLITIYSDRALTTPIANPQRTGSDGRAVNKIWIDGKYSLIVEDSANVQKLEDLSLGELATTNNTTLVNVQGADSITAEGSPAVTALVNNQVYIFTAAANNTGPVTLTIDLTPTWPIKKHHDLDLDANDNEANQTIAVIWNETDSIYELMTNSAIGPVNLAGNQTVADTKTFSDSTIFSGIVSIGGTLSLSKGADIASANDMVLLADGNDNDVTGSVTVNGMTDGVGNEARHFHADGAFILKHNTAASSGFSSLYIVQGEADITTAAGDEWDGIYDGALWRIVNYNRASKPIDDQGLRSITGTVSANALTAGLEADSLTFRSATLTDGAPTILSFSTLSLVVPSGATLGTIDTIQSRLILLAINNAGTVELAVVNLQGANNLDETTLVSTTTIGTGSDSDNAIYSTTARSNVAFRVVGFIESTQATAGTWATSPTTLQGAGGNALTAMSSLGYGQTWQSVSRTSGVTYYNTTGKPILLNYTFQAANGGNVTITVDGVTVCRFQNDTSTSVYTTLSAIVPHGGAYIATDDANSSQQLIRELR